MEVFLCWHLTPLVRGHFLDKLFLDDQGGSPLAAAAPLGLNFIHCASSATSFFERHFWIFSPFYIPGQCQFPFAPFAFPFPRLGPIFGALLFVKASPPLSYSFKHHPVFSINSPLFPPDNLLLNYCKTPSIPHLDVFSSLHSRVPSLRSIISHFFLLRRC